MAIQMTGIFLIGVAAGTCVGAHCIRQVSFEVMETMSRKDAVWAARTRELLATLTSEEVLDNYKRRLVPKVERGEG